MATGHGLFGKGVGLLPAAAKRMREEEGKDGKSKKLLGTLSPIYGMATGHGLFGKGVGLLPAAAKRMREEEAGSAVQTSSSATDQAALQPATSMPDTGMKKGGKVSSASSRADGCAQRGKTRGRVV